MVVFFCPSPFAESHQYSEVVQTLRKVNFEDDVTDLPQELSQFSLQRESVADVVE